MFLKLVRVAGTCISHPPLAVQLSRQLTILGRLLPFNRALVKCGWSAVSLIKADF